jgi:hypothetical protein
MTCPFPSFADRPSIPPTTVRREGLDHPAGMEMVYAQRQRASGRRVMTFQVGDRVVAESESTERPARTGTVREVLRADPSPRYRIEWDDGHTTNYTPAAGALQGAGDQAEAAS